MTIMIGLKLPSLNEYVNVCRTNRYKAAEYKRNIEKKILPYFAGVRRFEKPIRIHFTWIEDNKRRDYDNVCFAKKFILDAMVRGGYLKDDNRKCVAGFIDSFEYGETAMVILEIEEVNDDTERKDNAVYERFRKYYDVAGVSRLSDNEICGSDQ